LMCSRISMCDLRTWNELEKFANVFYFCSRENGGACALRIFECLKHVLTSLREEVHGTIAFVLNTHILFKNKTSRA